MRSHPRTGRTIRLVAATLVVAGLLAPAAAQKATERYIPIGESPGLSGKYTYIGPIKTVNTDERRMVIEGPEGEHTVEVTDRTRIWLDRSGVRRTNLTGGVEDCRPGRTIEVKFEDPETRRVAEWIKIRIDEP